MSVVDLNNINNEKDSIKFDMKPLQDFISLVKDNSTLPVVCMTDADIAADLGCGRYASVIGTSRIDRYVLCEERIYFYDVDDRFDLLNQLLGPDDVDKLTDLEQIDKYENLPWVDAIIVNIDECGDEFIPLREF